ncbi:MAG: 16S rRNA (cytidine(1402)-2'-O)-methyltransferase [Puniceicoccales bacterium]|nr:16S rRNA (cytidine(1402)-2'-O)-methyltransferase [Puniceicoccales bacterium]
MHGILSIVATPLGNLGDISERAQNVLREADLVVCEDTRVSAILLRHLGVSRPLMSCHEHNERRVAPLIADRVAAGEKVAVICDAGTPGVSDPGFRVVRECHRRGLPVSPVPGPCAFVAALVASGLPTNAFRFCGFAPPKSAARVRVLEGIREADETVIFYESCHRIEKFVQEIVTVLGEERVICVARELTKIHETILTGTAAWVRSSLTGNNMRGEFVVIVAPVEFVL